jgi:glucose-1-phosphate thymidylyltransferase
MRRAGITNIYIILRSGKFDLPAYLGDGRTLGLNLAYLMMGLPFGVPFTLDQAYPFVKDSVVALGFPDILFEADDAFAQILNRLGQGDCDVVLGVFPADRPDKVDMVEVGDGFTTRRIIIKPLQTDLRLTWGLAVWRPAFTHFMHEWLQSTVRAGPVDDEIFMGEAIQAAIEEGLRVRAVQVSGKPFLDVGTPEDLVTALRRFLDEA